MEELTELAVKYSLLLEQIGQMQSGHLQASEAFLDALTELTQATEQLRRTLLVRHSLLLNGSPLLRLVPGAGTPVTSSQSDL